MHARAAAVAVVLLPAGCSCGAAGEPTGRDGDAAAPTRTVEDLHGSVTVPAEPQRVAVVEHPFLEPLLELGVPVVADTTDSTSLSGGSAFTVSEGTGWNLDGITPVGTGEVDHEALVGAAPDLVVMPVYAPDDQRADYDRLARIAPTVAVPFESPDGVAGILRELAEVTGADEARLGQARAAYQARLDELVAAVAPVREELTVSAVQFSSAADSRLSDDPSLYAHVQVMADAGLLRPVAQVGSPPEEVSVERASEHDGDALQLLCFGDAEEPCESFFDQPTVAALSAVASGRAEVLRADQWGGVGWSTLAPAADQIRAALAPPLDTGAEFASAPAGG